VRCEQGWFTSIRSPLGNGYRLIAASPGLSAAEKRELVACAPTHDSLCDQSANGRGLAAFRLSSGRWCLFLSRHAGREPTARGGWLVETHVLVLEPDAYQQFGFNPLCVQAARDVALLSPADTRRSCLPPLELTSGLAATSAFDCAVAVDEPEIKQLSAVTAAVLEGTPVIGTVANPARALGGLMTAVPTAIRSRLSISCGLRFTPTRAFTLVLTDRLSHERLRLAEEHGYRVIKEAAFTLEPSAFEPWLRLAEDSWRRGGAAELDRISRQLTETCSAQALTQVAAMWLDLDLAEGADEATRRAICERHENTQALSSVYDNLRERLRASRDAHETAW